MKLTLAVEALEAEIAKQRANVRYAGDTADIVYYGEEIGKLKTALTIIKTYIQNNEN